jgi:hypothetical protein
MAFKFRGKGKKKGTSLRLTGMFKSKRRGLAVGSVDAGSDQMAGLIDKIKAAKADDKGLVWFLWRNEEEEGPAFTLSVDVSQDEDRPKKKRRPEPDEDDDEGDEDEDTDEKDDEVPF